MPETNMQQQCFYCFILSEIHVFFWVERKAGGIFFVELLIPGIRYYILILLE